MLHTSAQSHGEHHDFFGRCAACAEHGVALGCRVIVVGLGGDGSDGGSKTSLHIFDGALGMGTFQKIKAELAHQGYTIFAQWTDPSAECSTIASSVKYLGMFHTKAFENIHAIVSSLFPWERKQRPYENLDVWCPTVNEACLDVNGRASSRGYSPLSSTMKLLMEELEKPEICVPCGCGTLWMFGWGA